MLEMTSLKTPVETRQLEVLRKFVLGAGLAALGSGLLWQVSKFTRHVYRVGPLTGLAVAFGVVLVWIATRSRSARLISALALLLVNCVAVYLLMLLLDFYVYTQRPGDRMRGLQSTQHLFMLDDGVSFKLAPNWHGFYEDGKNRLEIRTNSLGHRDGEPRPSRPGVRQVILGGDSFTFGVLLAQDETIARQITRESGGAVDAYSTGVPSYGPRNVYETFVRLESLPASDFVYLFYNNDFEDVLRAWDDFTIYDGLMVHKLNEDGTPQTEDDLRRKLKTVREDQHHEILRRTLADAVTLRELRSRLGFDKLLDRWRARPNTAASSSHMAGVEPTLEYTLKMKELADRRHMSFWVFVIPTIWEAEKGDYEPDTKAFVDRLNDRGIRIIEPLRQLGYHDYISYDGHFEPSGAKIAGKAILAALAKP